MEGHDFRNTFLLILLVLAGLATGCSVGAQPPVAVTADNSASQQPPFTAEKPLVLPANTAIYVRLQQSLSSTTAQPGQNFAAVLDEPLVADGQTLAPKGTAIEGKVVAARESGHLHNAGYLRITLSSLTLNGKTVPIQTNSVYVSGGRYNRHNIALMGGGAGGGSLLSSLVGRKDAVTNSSAGVASGTTAAYASGKKEVGFVAERRLGFLLTQPLNIS
ncbi:MAG TPA: hypothetical protein VFT65_09705 [Candidatus Angelobacter sp.]|nr:hypothetical protein [Candidatus Angelobacter sp.]